jgi:predicted ABC-type ATPase
LSIETTLSGHTILKRLRETRDAGYEIGLNYIALNDLEVNITRVALWVMAGGH